MRVLFISDDSFTIREQSMFRRLEIGLLDEGARLVRAVPKASRIETDTALTRTLTFTNAGPKLMQPFRIAMFRDQIQRMAARSDNAANFDIIHAWGDQVWVLAREIAESTNAHLVLEAWSGRSIRRIKAAERATASRSTKQCLWSGSDAAIATRCAALATWPVRTHSWGVHVPSQPRRASEEGHPTSIIVAPDGHDATPTINFITALARVIKDPEDILLFLGEACVRGTTSVWKAVQQHGLDTVTSVLPDLDFRRDPALHADIIVFPESTGQHRSLRLDAMALGQLVLAQQDPLVEAYKHKRTSWCVAAPTVHLWQGALQTLLADAAMRRRIGLAARHYVETERRVYPHVASLMRSYEDLLAGTLLDVSSESLESDANEPEPAQN